MSELTFHRVISLGKAGKDVRAVKRALARAGYGPKRLRVITPIFGPYAVIHLKRYQTTIPVQPTGKYGRNTHERLIEHFDALGRLWYEQASGKTGTPIRRGTKSPSVNQMQLPVKPRATHQTAGLPGFPAEDLFARPGTAVLAPEDGRIYKLSGREPILGGSPGGAYGWSIYLRSRTGSHFMTHFGRRYVTLGQLVSKGDVIGTVCDSAVSGKPNTSHIHHGKRES